MRDVVRILCANGILGLRLFWKVSSLSRALAALKRDSSRLGLVSACLGLRDFVSEKEALRDLFEECFKRDDAQRVGTFLALEGVEPLFPFLLRILIERWPNAKNCLQLLTGRPVVSLCTDVPWALVPRLRKRDTLEGLLEGGVVKTNSWVHGPGGPFSPPGLFSIPLLSVLIGYGDFDCAQALLDAGGRVDMSEWAEANRSGISRTEVLSGPTPLHTLVAVLGAGKLWRGMEEARGVQKNLSAEERKKGLSLLRSLARAAKETGCLDWSTWIGLDWMGVKWLFGGGAGGCDLHWWHFGRAYEHTPLSLACVLVDREVIQILLEVGEYNQRHSGRWGSELVANAVCTDSRGCPGRHVSGDAAIAAAVEVLADGGVDLDARTLGGEAALCVAIKKGLDMTAEALIRRGASCRRLGPSNKSSVPLLEAIRMKNLPLISLLLKMRADPNETECHLLACVSVNENYNTPRDEDTFYREAVRATLTGSSPISTAIRVYAARGSAVLEDEFWSVLHLLVDAGGRCDTDPPDSPVESPLLFACLLGDSTLASFLCEKAHADPNGVGKVKILCSDIPSSCLNQIWKGTPLEFVLSDFGGDAKSYKRGEDSISVQWGLVKTLVSLGARPDLILQNDHPQNSPPNCSPEMPLGVTVSSPISRLIALSKDTRGPPLLLRIIETLPLAELQERQKEKDRDKEGDGKSDPAPLASALTVRWKEGLTALLERGWEVNRREDAAAGHGTKRGMNSNL